MSRLVDRAKALLERHREQARERRFLDAAMAASALVATADGEISLAELLSRDEVLTRVDALQAFDSNQAVDSFRGFVDAIEADAEAGAAQALAAVGAFGDEPELAHMLLRASVAIAKADSDFSAEEQAIIDRICEALGCEVVDFSAD